MTLAGVLAGKSKGCSLNPSNFNPLLLLSLGKEPPTSVSPAGSVTADDLALLRERFGLAAVLGAREPKPGTYFAAGASRRVNACAVVARASESANLIPEPALRE